MTHEAQKQRHGAQDAEAEVIVLRQRIGELEAERDAANAGEDNALARLSSLQAALGEARAALRVFARVGRVVEFYVEEALPELTFPKAGTNIDPDGPSPISLDPSDFTRARSALAASELKDDASHV